MQNRDFQSSLQLQPLSSFLSTRGPKFFKQRGSLLNLLLNWATGVVFLDKWWPVVQKANDPLEDPLNVGERP
jgi:hypothetical protein